MKYEGGCYCRAVRYRIDKEPIKRAQCFCRECQYLTGGAPNLFMLFSNGGFQYTKGVARTFTRQDIDKPVSRDFCSECGTHLISRRPDLEAVIVKVGTLDDPRIYGAPDFGVFGMDKQPFHWIPQGMPVYERLPVRADGLAGTPQRKVSEST